MVFYVKKNSVTTFFGPPDRPVALLTFGIVVKFNAIPCAPIWVFILRKTGGGRVGVCCACLGWDGSGRGGLGSGREGVRWIGVQVQLYYWTASDTLYTYCSLI
jgi:hypothetical protein